MYTGLYASLYTLEEVYTGLYASLYTLWEVYTGLYASLYTLGGIPGYMPPYIPGWYTSAHTGLPGP